MSNLNNLNNLKPTTKFLLLALVAVVFLSGCTGQEDGKVEYKDDIITVEEYYVDNVRPYENSLATISFLVKNNGDPLEQDENGVDVEINFFEIEPFAVDELVCDGEGYGEDVAECTLNDIGSLDAKAVSITLKSPDLPGGSPPISPTVSYSVGYEYSGVRAVNIPVIDGTSRTIPLKKATQSEPTYGPVQLEFEPPVGSMHKEDDKIVKEYWGVMGRPFEVKMEFQHVGDSSVGIVQPFNISKGDLTLTLSSNIRRVSDLTCDFSENLVSQEDVMLPTRRTELVCNFENTLEMEPPESLATITAEFEYDYKYIRTETFTIEPRDSE